MRENKLYTISYLRKLVLAVAFDRQGRIEGGFLGFQETPFDSKTFLK